MEHQVALGDLEACRGVEVPRAAGGEVVEGEIAQVLPVSRIGEGVGAGKVRRRDLDDAARHEQLVHLLDEALDVRQVLDDVVGVDALEVAARQGIRPPVEIEGEVGLDLGAHVDVETIRAPPAAAAEVELPGNVTSSQGGRAFQVATVSPLLPQWTVRGRMNPTIIIASCKARR